MDDQPAQPRVLRTAKQLNSWLTGELEIREDPTFDQALRLGVAPYVDREADVHRPRSPWPTTKHWYYTLTEKDAADLTMIADARQAAKRVSDRTSNNVSPFTEHEVDWFGTAAELAVEAVTGGASFWRQVSAWGHKDEPDIVLPGGKTIDVKMNSKRWDDLTFNGSHPAEALRMDAAILCQPTEQYGDLQTGSVYQLRTIEIVGWISYAEFARKYKRHTTYWHGVRRRTCAVKAVNPALTDRWFELQLMHTLWAWAQGA